MEQILQLDTDLMLLLNFDGGGFADQFWWYVSKTTTWLWLYALLLWFLWHQCGASRVAWRRFAGFVILTAIVVLLADQISSGLIKPLVMRPRPSRPDSGISGFIHTVNNYRGGHYGFVSSHAANTWGVALWFILLVLHRNKCFADAPASSPVPIRPYAIVPMLVAYSLLSCYSRIYLGVHYPGDILGGLLVGTLAALITYYVLFPLVNKRVKSAKSTE